MKAEIIGRGIWLDKVAAAVVRRLSLPGRLSSTLRTESGIGASGLPHIGSFADAARAYGVKLAIEDRGYASEYIAFSDDKDGLRRVPVGLPAWLKRHIAKPVTDIPDPYRCHGSYGDHMSSLLLDALDKTGIQYTYISASKAYREGLFVEGVRRVLDASERVGEIIREQISQEKYLEALPYFPVCEGCGRIYTTRAYRWSPREWKVLYRCEAAGIRGEQVPGCGHEGEVDIREGRGKLSWKAEFAVRWEALNIDFEAYGKDIADSVRVNDEIMREVLRREPPYHVRYEMFLDKGGRKISKSTGNVLTPQVWLRYGSSSSLLLLMFKRIVGTRELSVEDIPKYMDELDNLEDIYFGKKKVEDERERAKLKGLYEYCHLLKPPQNPSVHVPYATLLELAGVAPAGREKEFIIRKLTQYGVPWEKDPEEISRRIAYALNWIRDFRVETRMESPLTGAEKNALETLIKGLKDCDSEEAIQNLAFKAAKEAGVPSKRFFQIVYMRLLNKSSGPKLGPYIASLGIEKAIERLQASM